MDQRILNELAMCEYNLIQSIKYITYTTNLMEMKYFKPLPIQQSTKRSRLRINYAFQFTHGKHKPKFHY